MCVFNELDFMKDIQLGEIYIQDEQWLTKGMANSVDSLILLFCIYLRGVQRFIKFDA